MTKSNRLAADIQSKIDDFWERFALPILPKNLTPNQLSLLRLALVPALAALFYFKLFLPALLLFIAAALLDSLDGALARRRNLITSLGLIVDPLADKLLIAVTGWSLLFYYPFKMLLAGIIILEIMIGLASAFALIGEDIKSSINKSNIWGKLKMVLQSLGLAGIMLWLLSGWPLLAIGSFYILAASFFCQIISGAIYLKKPQPDKKILP